MSIGQEKLARDVATLYAMAEEMDIYLRKDVLFWHMQSGGTPLTLGGYLLRQHRLLALDHLLGSADRVRVETAVTLYNEALVEKIVRLEQKAHQELDARLRQWGESLRDLDRGEANTLSNYATAVEVRAIIAALIDQLDIAPYQLEARIPRQVTLYDRQLRLKLQENDFIWPTAWQTAYPKSEFWWLYGVPRQQ